MAVTTWALEFEVDGPLEGRQSDPDLAVLADGRVAMVWVDATVGDPRVMARLFDSGLVPVSDAFVVDQASGGALAPDVAALADGGFAVVTRQIGGAPDSVALTAVSDEGTVLDRQTVTALASDGQAPDVLAAGGTVWVGVVRDPGGTGNDGVFGSRFSWDGARLSFVETQAAALTDAGNERAPDLAALADGSMAMVWRQGSAVRLQVLDREGAPALASDRTVSDEAAGASANPEVTALANGALVVSYVALASGAPGALADVRIRLYTAAGEPLGGETLVNARTALNQLDPVVTPLADGGFAVFWLDTAPAETAVRGQLFGPLGAARGGVFTVSDGAAAAGDDLDAATLPDGRIVLAWADGGEGGTLARAMVLDPRDGRIDGTAGDDLLWGNIGADQLTGLSGDDTLRAGAGADRAEGGRDADLVLGEDGADLLAGGQGLDTLDGGRGGDMLIGGGGADVLRGRAGADTLRGSYHDDILDGGPGADELRGGAGFDRAAHGGAARGVRADLKNPERNGGEAAGDRYFSIEALRGSAHRDTLLGGDGGDGLEGGDGDDVLQGRRGSDRIDGGRGRDRLAGGTGDDTLTGGGAHDRFDFRRGHDRDTITDFKPGVDTLVLSRDLLAAGLSPQGVLDRHAELRGDDLVLIFGEGDRVTLEGLGTREIADDLLLV